MKKILLPLLVLLIVGAVGAYLWLTRPGAPSAVSADAAASEATRLRRGGAGQNQSADFASVQHREETETMFSESLRYLAPGATAPLVHRAPAGTPSEKASAETAPVSVGSAEGSARNIREVRAEERLWSGVILVPTSTVLGFGHTALVELRRIEVHPRTDRRMRVWARLANTTGDALKLGVACGFRSEGETDNASPVFETIVIPAGGYRDVVFLSPKSDVNRYTVLVRH